MLVIFCNYGFYVLGIIILVLNSITILMATDKSIKSMLFQYALEIFLVMSLYNYLVFISFRCSENKKKISDLLSTLNSRLSKLNSRLSKLNSCLSKLNSCVIKFVGCLIKFVCWLIEFVGWLKKCQAKPYDENKDNPEDVQKGDPKSEKNYDMRRNMIRPRVQMN